MKYFFFASVLNLMASVPATPLEERDVQIVNLIFNGGPAQYTLSFPADGTVYPTNNDLSIDTIDAPDYDAYTQCRFYTPDNATLASSVSPAGVNEILVGPPQPVTGVSCLGMCVPTYGDCFIDGSPVGPCCAGYCAGDRCRPWVNPS